jgi:hypothetical protein
MPTIFHITIFNKLVNHTWQFAWHRRLITIFLEKSVVTNVIKFLKLNLPIACVLTQLGDLCILDQKVAAALVFYLCVMLRQTI